MLYKMKEMIFSAHEMDFVSKKSLTALASEWLNSRNQLLSYLMEEQVTNRQLMHVVHCSAAFLAALGMAEVNLFGCGLCIGWLAIALYLAKKKGGLR